MQLQTRSGSSNVPGFGLCPTQSGHKIYKIYARIKILFNEGRLVKPKGSFEVYAKRNDVALFEKLATRTDDYVLAYFIGNLLENSNMHISDMSEENMHAWKRNIANMYINASNDLTNILKFAKSRNIMLNKIFEITETSTPIIIRLAEVGKIKKESVAMFECIGILSDMKMKLDKMNGFGKTLNNIVNKYYGYSQILKVDCNKAKDIIGAFVNLAYDFGVVKTRD